MSRRGALAVLAPYLVGSAVLFLVPALLTFRYAVTDATGFTPPRFTGAENLRRLLADPVLTASLRASLVHVALTVPLRLLAATALGLLLAAPRPGGRWYRVAVYLPTVIPDIALVLLFAWVLNPLYGPLNQLLAAVGGPTPAWLAEPWGARLGIAMMLLFPIGEAFVVVLAARRELDGRLYEAAVVDGLPPWTQLVRITLPQLAPILVLLAIRDTIFTLQVNFVPAYLLTDGRPLHATLYLPLYIYDHSFEFLGFGYGAMLTVLLLAVTVVLIGAQLLLVRRWRIVR